MPDTVVSEQRVFIPWQVQAISRNGMGNGGILGNFQLHVGATRFHASVKSNMSGELLQSSGWRGWRYVVSAKRVDGLPRCCRLVLGALLVWYLLSISVSAVVSIF